MIEEGFELMAVGMGVVFCFLVLLVMLMKVSGYLLSKVPEQSPETTPLSKVSRLPKPAQQSAKIAAAIAAAYRAKNKQ